MLCWFLCFFYCCKSKPTGKKPTTILVKSVKAKIFVCVCAWSYITMDRIDSLKTLKEQFVSNLGGTTMYETMLLQLVLPVCTSDVFSIFSSFH